MNQDPQHHTFKLHLRLADRIGLEILRGTFEPGDALPTEARLCESYGVSRTAVREAVRGLIAKGLLESKSKVGTRVRRQEFWSHMDPDVLRWRLALTDTSTYVRKMFELRQAVEPAAAASAAENACEGDHFRLSAAFEAMVAAGDDDAAWVDADLAFHKAIYLATHNEFFWPIGQLFEIGLREMFAIAAQGSHRPRALVEHRALLEAILSGDPSSARAATEALIGNAADDIDLIRRTMPSAGDAGS
jgi:DNA-binding FadR family transcriptional regulator